MHSPLSQVVSSGGGQTFNWNLHLLDMPKLSETRMLLALWVLVRVKWKVIFFYTSFSFWHHISGHMEVVKSYATLWLKYNLMKSSEHYQSDNQKQCNRNVCLYCWQKKIPNGMLKKSFFTKFFFSVSYLWYDSIINQYFTCFALLVCLFEIESHVPIVRLELTT